MEAVVAGRADRVHDLQDVTCVQLTYRYDTMWLSARICECMIWIHHTMILHTMWLSACNGPALTVPSGIERVLSGTPR